MNSNVLFDEDFILWYNHFADFELKGLLTDEKRGKADRVSGGDDVSVNLGGVGILLYLALVSSVAYTVWGLLLRSNSVSRIAIFGFMTPVMGVVLSALLLGEAGQLGIRHILSLVLVCAGIIVVNKE